MFVAACSALHIGHAGISVLQGLSDLWQGEQTIAANVLGQIRLPRVILAIIVGATLGMAGAAMQGLLRNPLADPGVLGVTGAGRGLCTLFWFGRECLVLVAGSGNCWRTGRFIYCVFIGGHAEQHARAHPGGRGGECYYRRADCGRTEFCAQFICYAGNCFLVDGLTCQSPC